VLVGDIADGTGEARTDEFASVAAGESGGVGRLLSEANGGLSSPKWKGMSKRGDRSCMVTVCCTMSLSSAAGSNRTTGCSKGGRNSEEAVFEDLDNRGR
jgi:hypothetical protein